jgi:restriction system protein
MDRQKSKAKQQEEFLKALFGLVGLGGLFGTYYLTKSLNTSVIVAVILIAIVITIMVIRQLNHIERLKKSNSRYRSNGWKAI